ncbi:hypothetical protein DSM107003_01920 [Trichormus variabilis SAG 1403-4b]|uniref:Serine protease n=2 Tax=Anabaena variabilis TaxID=264691 RepID=A0A3S1CDL3_ANAVA|nr:hypothetical protein DSM107003_01920 [Trichormus variabilis SAG 1403-4b]
MWEGVTSQIFLDWTKMRYLRVSLIALIAFLSCILSAEVVYPKDKQIPTIVSQTNQSESDLSVNALREITRAISVKIIAGQGWGTGVIISKKGQVYTVVTNAHVLRLGTNYQVQTLDGKIYNGQLIKAINFQDDDLGLLTFKSNQNYAIASIANTPLVVGDQTFAAGFPNQTKTWSFTVGKVDYVLPKSFIGGYQVGYSNDILKGMSGGPVINQRGKLVAINGRHKYPLWGNPFIFQDGSTPVSQIRAKFEESSWAVSMQIFLQHAPQFASGSIYPDADPSSSSAVIDLEKSSNVTPSLITKEKPVRSFW